MRYDQPSPAALIQLLLGKTKLLQKQANGVVINYTGRIAGGGLTVWKSRAETSSASFTALSIKQ